MSKYSYYNLCFHIFYFTICWQVLLCWNGANGHGRLIEPPSRSSMWRYGFNTTANYNDHELYCGGFARQYQRNNGKCGICGDAWDMPSPRPNEAGGVYGQGVIVRKYQINSIIRIKVELTANHRGYFEFRLCPNNNAKKVASQKCLDKYILQQSNGEGARYYPGEGTKVFESRYLLPRDVTCTQCVLQWRYLAANNWGHCPNGTEQIGCGPQEQFRACADVAITDGTGHASTEEDESVDINEIITNELDDDTNAITSTVSPVDEAYYDSTFWPIAIVFICLVFAILVVAALFGWFYRKSACEFARESFRKCSSCWRLNLHLWSKTRRPSSSTTTSNNNNNFSQHVPHPPSCIISSGTKDDHANNMISYQPTSFQKARPPIPPPRTKKINLSPQVSREDELYHNYCEQQSPPIIKSQLGQPRPDIISQQPIHVTINGLAL